jgi:hypothetical protein
MMNEDKIRELAGILYQASIVQLEFQDKSYQRGIEELRYVYHGIAIEILNSVRGQECTDWRDLIQSRLARTFGGEESVEVFMSKVKEIASK